MSRDPRVGNPKDLNDALQDRMIRHMIYLERYKTSEVKRVKDILDKDILPDLADRIEARVVKMADRGFDTGKLTTNRLRALARELKELSDRMARRLAGELSVQLDLFGDSEVSWQIGVIRDELNFDIALQVPPPAVIAGLANEIPFAGFTLDKWFDTLSESTQRTITKIVQQSLVEGETVQQTMRRIRGTRALGYTDGALEVTRRQAEAITRSAVNHVTNQARNKLFEQNSDVIQALQWISTLDGRTTLICASRDGKVTAIGKNTLPKGAIPLKPSDARPPAHVNCRSTMAPIIKGLGLPKGMRSSVSGQVPASVTYPEWLKGQSNKVQAEVLGKTKAKLFREGGLTLEKFNGTGLKPLTLDQLKQVEKTAFQKAGVDI